jgi:hypothetical protein
MSQALGSFTFHAHSFRLERLNFASHSLAASHQDLSILRHRFVMPLGQLFRRRQLDTHHPCKNVGQPRANQIWLELKRTMEVVIRQVRNTTYGFIINTHPVIACSTKRLKVST